MHPLYTEQQLFTKPLSELKTIYTQIGASVEVADKRCKSLWVNAIATYQSSQVQKVEPTRSENDVNFIDIDGFYNFEAQVNGETIAELSHDAFNDENPWYVSSIFEKPVFRRGRSSESSLAAWSLQV